MVVASSPARRRLGRPPAGDSAATRARILDAARRSFAERGFGSSTNKTLAGDSGVSTAALYHYFDSKLDLYVAVHDDVEGVVYGCFAEAIVDESTLIGQIEALLDAAYRLNGEDPTLARFLGSVRIDVRRHPELAERLGPALRRQAHFYRQIIDTGIRTGEIDLADERRVSVLLRTVLIGLTDAVSDDLDDHRLATDALKSLLEGKLLRSADRPATAAD